MRVLTCKISSQFEADIKISWLKQTKIKVPTRHVMYMFSEPQNWDEIDKLPFNKETIQDFTKIINDNLENENSTFAELLLKIAGEHPNYLENTVIRRLINNRGKLI